ncbi:hypothetical protein GOODEAATRI_013052, partial [Goodea atripinnis]
SCGSHPWILNSSSSDSYFRTSINRPPLQSPTVSSSLPALQQIAKTSPSDALDPWISDTQIVPETLPRSLLPGDTKPEDRTLTT